MSPLACLPVKSLSPGGTGPRIPWSGTLHKNLVSVCVGCGIVGHLRQYSSTDSSSSSCEFVSGWPPERHIASASPGLIWSPFDQEGPRSGSCPQQTETVQSLPPLRKAARSPQRSASWVKLSPGRRPPLCPISEIRIHHWGLPITSFGV